MRAIPPRHWAKQFLEELCTEITVGHVGSMANEYLASGIPFLRSQNIAPFRIDLTDIKYISSDFHQKLKKSALKPGDVAVVRTGYPGTAAVIPSKLAVSNCADLVVIRPSDKIDPWFLACIFNSAWGKNTVAGNLVGVAQQHFNVGAARKMRISLPPICEQQRIATILSAYDDLIENNTRRIAILEEIAKRLYDEWFAHFRFPGHENTKFSGDLPEGWKSAVIGGLVSEIRDAVHPSTVEPETPYVGLEHLPRKSFTLRDWSTADTVSSTKLRFLSRDILFGKIRPYFHKVVVAPIDGVCSSDTILLRPREKHFLPIALCCTSSEAFVRHATQTSNGTKMPRADWKVLQDYPLAVPPHELMESFNNLVEPCIAQSQALMFKNANLRTQRDLLLPKLISGEIDVSRFTMPDAADPLDA